MINLLKQLIRPNQNHSHIRQAFHFLNQKQLYQFLQFAISNQIDFNMNDQGQKITLIMKALQFGLCQDKKLYQDGLKLIHFLVNHGADINKTDSKGKTALIIACHYKLHDYVQFLINFGSNINCQSFQPPKLNPLYCSLFKEQYQTAFFIINHGAQIKRVIELQQINKNNGFVLSQESILWLKKVQNIQKLLLLKEKGIQPYKSMGNLTIKFLNMYL